MDQKPSGIDDERDCLDDLTASEAVEPVECSEIQDDSATKDDGYDADEYVRQLIARMGPGQSQSVTPLPVTPPKLPKVDPAPNPGKSFERPLAPLPLANAPNSLDKLTTNRSRMSGKEGRSGAKGVRPVDLAKLREAANITTSGALQAFDCKGLVRRAYSQLAMALGCMATSLILLGMSDGARSAAYIASVSLTVIAAVTTFQYNRTTRVLGQTLQHSS